MLKVWNAATMRNRYVAVLKPQGIVGARLSNVAALAAKANSNTRGEFSRGPVKSRLGYYPYHKDQRQQRQWRNRGQDKEKNRQYSRSDYSQMMCDFCGIKGHIKRKCFKLKKKTCTGMHVFND